MSRKDSISVLLVDDEEAFTCALSKRLKKRGLNIIRANEAKKALKLVRQYDFDIAVIDLKMPEMDGLALLKIFRDMDPDLPIIMLTGHGSEEAACEGMRLGAFEYLIKPADFDELMVVIRKAVALRFEGKR